MLGTALYHLTVILLFVFICTFDCKFKSKIENQEKAEFDFDI